MNVHYRVRFRPSAEKELAKLDPPVRARVLRHITALVGNPRPPGATRLVSTDNLWRIRIGDYQALNHNLLTELVQSTTLVPPDLTVLGPPTE